MVFGSEQMPLEDSWVMERIVLAEMFGWPLDVVDNLSLEDLIGIRAFLNAREKRRAELRDSNG